MKDYIFILVAIVILVIKMVEASRKQKEEAAKRAMSQQKPDDSRSIDKTYETYEAPEEAPSYPEYRDIFGEEFLEEEAPPLPPSRPVLQPVATPAGEYQTMKSQSYQDEIKKYQERPASLPMLTSEMPQLATSRMTTLDDLRIEGGSLDAEADNTAWLTQEILHGQEFDLRAAVIMSTILNRPYAS